MYCCHQVSTQLWLNIYISYHIISKCTIHVHVAMDTHKYKLACVHNQIQYSHAPVCTDSVSTLFSYLRSVTAQDKNWKIK
jgi:hypothetical protein